MGNGTHINVICIVRRNIILNIFLLLFPINYTIKQINSALAPAEAFLDVELSFEVNTWRLKDNMTKKYKSHSCPMYCDCKSRSLFDLKHTHPVILGSSPLPPKKKIS